MKKYFLSDSERYIFEDTSEKRFDRKFIKYAFCNPYDWYVLNDPEANNMFGFRWNNECIILINGLEHKYKWSLASSTNLLITNNDNEVCYDFYITHVSLNLIVLGYKKNKNDSIFLINRSYYKYFNPKSVEDLEDYYTFLCLKWRVQLDEANHISFCEEEASKLKENFKKESGFGLFSRIRFHQAINNWKIENPDKGYLFDYL